MKTVVKVGELWSVSDKRQELICVVLGLQSSNQYSIYWLAHYPILPEKGLMNWERYVGQHDLAGFNWFQEVATKKSAA